VNTRAGRCFGSLAAYQALQLARSLVAGRGERGIFKVVRRSSYGGVCSDREQLNPLDPTTALHL
jgi:hypothetical protein